MKNIVIYDEYAETDLKPSALLQKYIRMAEKDVKGMLIKNKRLKKVACPGCHSTKIRYSFSKMGLTYQECGSCATVYVSPRPADRDLAAYYTQSAARHFWHEKISIPTEQKRKEKIIKPRMDWMVESVQEFSPHARHIADINTAQAAYIGEIRQCAVFTKKTLVNPFVPAGSNASSASGIDVIEAQEWGQALKGQVDVVSLFEVLDRTSDIDGLFGKVRLALKEKGLCFLTAILISGFDMQVLWKDAANLYPPDRLNLFSVEGLKVLSSRHGFECIEFSTPGVLDMEIVSKAVQAHAGKFCRFAEYLVRNRDENLRHAFQVFLQKELLSSCGRILLRKGG